MPQVSIVMPVYNGQAYLKLAVESILKQAFSDFEFIIINDGSTDKSHQILQRYARADSRIQLRSRPNTGIVGALNEGVRLATTELVARMDADDISEPGRLQYQIDFLKRAPRCVAVGCAAWIIDDRSAVVDLYKPPETHAEIMAELLRANGGALLHPSVLMRKTAIIAAGGYAEEFCKAEDLDLYLRMARHGELCNLPTPLLRYRQHILSTNYQHHARQRHLAEKILERERPIHGLPPLDLDAVRSHASLNVAERHQRWSTKACVHGTSSTALRHALIGLWHAPLNRYSWKVLKLALRTIAKK